MKLIPAILLTLPFFVFAADAPTATPTLPQSPDWPEFRGPTADGVSSAKDVPTQWSPTKNVAWRTDLPGHAWSSPVLSNGKLYLTSATGGPGTKDKPALYAVCLDAATGKPIWDTEVFRPNQAGGMHSKNSLASATPIVTADRLYVHFGHLGTAALDLAGKVIWRQTIAYSPVHGNGGSPVLYNDLLIFNCDGASNPFVIALDAKSGEPKWKTPRNGHSNKNFSFSTPLVIDVDGKPQLISPASGFVGSYDPLTGREIWRVNYGDGYSVVPRPVYANGLLFLSSGFDAPVMYCIDPKNATGDATREHVKWTARKGAPNTPSPLALGDEIYFISDGGIATCADQKTGKVHWTQRLNGKFSASPVAAEGRIYFQNEAGQGTVLKAAKDYETIATNDIEEPTLASYAVTDGALFIRTDKHLYKIGK